MKTALIDGKQPATIDPTLFNVMELVPATARIVWSESMLIGIRNEDGAIYRIIGVTGVTNFVHALTELHYLGYKHDIVNSDEAQRGFDEIVCMSV